ncbi:MAG: DUF202 domain-containing protein, partial [Desulfosarcinaceae bacterium]
MTASIKHHRDGSADGALMDEGLTNEGLMDEGLTNNGLTGEGFTDEDVTCTEQSTESDAVLIGEAQLILAEKRTSMAAMRTGIAVFALPLSVLGLLIATSRLYDVLHVLPLIIPLGIMLTALVVLGSYLIIRALRHIHHEDRMIRQLKNCHSK